MRQGRSVAPRLWSAGGGLPQAPGRFGDARLSLGNDRFLVGIAWYLISSWMASSAPDNPIRTGPSMEWYVPFCCHPAITIRFVISRPTAMSCIMTSTALVMLKIRLCNTLS